MKKKWIATIGLSVFIVTAGSGCANKQEAQVDSVKQEALEDINSQENSTLQEDEISDAKSVKTELLDGSVRGIGDNGIVIIKTRMEEREDGTSLAIAPAEGDETEEDYVDVNFTDQTKIELFIVKNNGMNPDEDVTVQQASLSDIKSDMSVTLEGFYEGEVFVAEKVTLYEFV